jgi:molybdate transport system substrate-binding protein
MTLGHLASTLALAILVTTAHADVRTLQVAAASDLASALPEIGHLFEQATGNKIRFSFGSSGLLAHQIKQGAPFDLFFSADIQFVDSLIRAGLCTEDSKRVYAHGQLVLYTPSGVPPPSALSELLAPRFRKIAIANPEHAPYGRAAKEALIAAGLWPTLLPRLVYGENIQQTLTFAETGNADAALVARSLVAGVTGERLPIDTALHHPITQASTLCGRRQVHDQARAFASFVTSSTGQAVLARYGFSLPSRAP